MDRLDRVMLSLAITAVVIMIAAAFMALMVIQDDIGRLRDYADMLARTAYEKGAPHKDAPVSAE